MDFVTVSERDEKLGISSDPWDARCRLRLNRVESWHETETNGQPSTAVTLFSGDIYILKIDLDRFDAIMRRYGPVKLISDA